MSSGKHAKSVLVFVLSAALLGSCAWWLSCAVRHYAAGQPDRFNQAMVRAIAANDIPTVKRYLAEGADPNTAFRYLDEPLESRGFSPRALWLRIRGGPEPQPCETALRP